MTISISKKTWAGIALEPVPGTFTAPTRYIPTRSTIKTDRKPIYSDEDRYTRDKNFLPQYGPRHGTIDFKGRWFNDSCADFLYAWMGGWSVGSVNALSYKHSFTMADIPPTWSFAKAYASEAYKITQAGCEKLSLSITADKVIEYDASFSGHFPVVYSGPPSPTFTADPGFAGYLPSLTLASLGASTTDIIDLKVDMSQKLEMWNPIAGIPDFTTLYYGDREINLDFTARFDASTLWDGWLATTDDSVTIDVKGALIGQVAVVSLGVQSSGTFTILYKSQETAPILYNATGADVQAAVRLLPGVGTNISVTGNSGGPYTFSITGELQADPAVITGSGIHLGAPGPLTIVTTAYYQELNLSFPIVNYESVEHDEGKVNVTVKVKAKVRPDPTQAAAIMTAFVQNTISTYAAG